MKDPLQQSIDDVARVARRHVGDHETSIHRDVCLLYSRLLAHQREQQLKQAATPKPEQYSEPR